MQKQGSGMSWYHFIRCVLYTRTYWE